MIKTHAGDSFLSINPFFQDIILKIDGHVPCPSYSEFCAYDNSITQDCDGWMLEVIYNGIHVLCPHTVMYKFNKNQL